MSDSSKSAFFKQSGWMVLTTVGGGGFMMLVHSVAAKMPVGEYAVFFTLLQILNLMGIPAVGLQSVFAQQAAAALTDEARERLAGTLRSVLMATFLLWLAAAAVVIFFQQQIITSLQMSSSAAFWVTLFVGLAALWQPIVWGILQGRQNFLWFGLSTFLNGFARFTMVCIIILLFHGYAAGAMLAALMGLIITVISGGWPSWDLFKSPTRPMAWKPWLKHIVPLTLGFGSVSFMMAFDMIIVQSRFPKDENGYYAAAGMIGRALVFITIPMTSVLFPKIVQSAAKAEKTNLMTQAIIATAIVGGLAALVCTVMPWLPLRIIFRKGYLEAAPLVPWFAWAMLPLTLSNVLISNLLARERFKVSPLLFLVAAGYGLALTFGGKTPLAIIQTLGVFSTLLLGVTLGFSYLSQDTKRTAA